MILLQKLKQLGVLALFRPVPAYQSHFQCINFVEIDTELVKTEFLQENLYNFEREEVKP